MKMKFLAFTSRNVSSREGNVDNVLILSTSCVIWRNSYASRTFPSYVHAAMSVRSGTTNACGFYCLQGRRIVASIVHFPPRNFSTLGREKTHFRPSWGKKRDARNRTWRDFGACIKSAHARNISAAMNKGNALGQTETHLERLAFLLRACDSAKCARGRHFLHCNREFLHFWEIAGEKFGRKMEH